MHYKIGITEQGDPSLAVGKWTMELQNVHLGIIVTKNLTDEMIDALLANRGRVILHHVITGYGGSVLEPNVYDVDTSFKLLGKLLNSGFPTGQVVLRVDPIIPSTKGIETFRSVIRKTSKSSKLVAKVKRCRIGMIRATDDCLNRMFALHPPMKERLSCLCRDRMAPEDIYAYRLNLVIKKLNERWRGHIQFETTDSVLTMSDHVDLVSKRDIAAMGWVNAPDDTVEIQEILGMGAQPCAIGCKYCYYPDP